MNGGYAGILFGCNPKGSAKKRGLFPNAPYNPNPSTYPLGYVDGLGLHAAFKNSPINHTDVYGLYITDEQLWFIADESLKKMESHVYVYFLSSDPFNIGINRYTTLITTSHKYAEIIDPKSWDDLLTKLDEARIEKPINRLIFVGHSGIGGNVQLAEDFRITQIEFLDKAKPGQRLRSELKKLKERLGKNSKGGLPQVVFYQCDVGYSTNPEVDKDIKTMLEQMANLWNAEVLAPTTGVHPIFGSFFWHTARPGK